MHIMIAMMPIMKHIVVIMNIVVMMQINGYNDYCFHSYYSAYCNSAYYCYDAY